MNLNQQDLRLQAIAAQLHALHSQLLVIKSLDCEHSMGVENTFECQRLYDRTHDLVSSARVIGRNIDHQESDTTGGSLKAFQLNAELLGGDAERFNSNAGSRAQLRLDETVEKEGPAPKGADIPSDSHALASKAGSCCFKAETCQYSTFSMQVKAICNLCSEMLFVAAALQSNREAASSK